LPKKAASITAGRKPFEVNNLTMPGAMTVKSLSARMLVALPLLALGMLVAPLGLTGMARVEGLTPINR
jgi:hypothetical protein